MTIFASNADEAAELCGVSMRLFERAYINGMNEFCRPSQPGKNNGEYPIEECKAFIAEFENNSKCERSDPPSKTPNEFESEIKHELLWANSHAFTNSALVAHAATQSTVAIIEASTNAIAGRLEMVESIDELKEVIADLKSIAGSPQN